MLSRMIIVAAFAARDGRTSVAFEAFRFLRFLRFFLSFSSAAVQPRLLARPLISSRTTSGMVGQAVGERP
jgi:hypothetical protein